MVVLIEVIEILLCYIIAYSTGGNIDDYIRLNVWLNSPSPDRILCDSKYLNMCYFQIPPLMKIIFMITQNLGLVDSSNIGNKMNDLELNN